MSEWGLDNPDEWKHNRSGYTKKCRVPRHYAYIEDNAINSINICVIIKIRRGNDILPTFLKLKNLFFNEHKKFR